MCIRDRYSVSRFWHQNNIRETRVLIDFPVIGRIGGQVCAPVLPMTIDCCNDFISTIGVLMIQVKEQIRTTFYDHGIFKVYVFIQGEWLLILNVTTLTMIGNDDQVNPV